jgi:hypothetical protein
VKSRVWDSLKWKFYASSLLSFCLSSNLGCLKKDLDFGEPTQLFSKGYFYGFLFERRIRELGLKTAMSCSVMLFLRPLESVSLKSFHFCSFS